MATPAHVPDKRQLYVGLQNPEELQPTDEDGEMNIGALKPVDRTAALVVSRGIHYEMSSKNNQVEYVGPPKMVSQKDFPRTSTFIDLTGRSKGWLKVLGMMQGGGGRWVVRCVCGTYTTRSAKSIKSAEIKLAANFDACRECMHIAHMKREEIYRRTGKDVNISEVW